MFFIQLPPTIPMAKRLTNAEGNETTKSSTSSEVLGSSEKSCSLDELSAGLMGKMLVYRSGAVKLKLGDTLYDVSTFQNPLHISFCFSMQAEGQCSCH